MPHELVNLLPPERIRAFRRDYFFRLATVAMLFATALVAIHGILLVPSYLAVSQAQKEKETQLASLSARLAQSNQGAVDARVTQLKSDATYLTRLSSTPSASSAIRAVLAVSRPGISISSITFTPPSGGAANGTMVISGTAATRESLRAYNQALSSAPFVSNVNLPINAYAEESNISFSMTLTGTLQP